MELINTKNSDVSDLFKDLNFPQNISKDKRKEIEDYYVEVFIVALVSFQMTFCSIAFFIE